MLFLKVEHFVIIIKTSSVCLLTTIFIISLEYLITHTDTLLLSTLKPLKFNLKLSLMGGIQ